MRKLTILALLVLAGCGDSVPDRVWSGSRSVLRNATTVEAYRVAIQAPLPGKEKEFEPDWWKWSMKSGPIAVDAVTARQLADFFLDEKSYYTGPPRTCIVQPGVKFRFVEGKEVVSVLLCLDCLSVFVQNPDGVKTSADLDPAVRTINALAKKAFPKDPEIQAIKD